MNDKVYMQLKKYWVYLHPVTKALTFIEFNSGRLRKWLRKKTRRITLHHILTLMLASFVFAFLSVYTYDVFKNDLEVWGSAGGFLFYFMPSITLLILMHISRKNRNLGGLLFILVSYGLFFPYNVSIGLIVSLLLLLTGLMYLTDHKIRRKNYPRHKRNLYI
ncbi:MAG: hypothetical protein Q7T54_00600 [Candidatus Levybacteria bacterium]|nr:hypothetical protein [Candidatus Levybacteria bacterium]